MSDGEKRTDGLKATLQMCDEEGNASHFKSTYYLLDLQHCLFFLLLLKPETTNQVWLVIPSVQHVTANFIMDNDFTAGFVKREKAFSPLNGSKWFIICVTFKPGDVPWYTEEKKKRKKICFFIFPI